MKQVTYTGNDLAREVPTMPEWLHPVQTFPVLHGHNWEIGQTYEEGRDYKVKKTSAFFSGNYQNKCSSCGKMFKEADKYWTLCQSCCDKPVLQPIVNDVASDSKASPSLASHSCTEGNSIEQIYQWALNNKIDAELAKKDESDQLSKMFLSGVIAAFNDLLNYIPNPEGSVATPDPSSNEVDNIKPNQQCNK